MLYVVMSNRGLHHPVYVARTEEEAKKYLDRIEDEQRQFGKTIERRNSLCLVTTGSGSYDRWEVIATPHSAFDGE